VRSLPMSDMVRRGWLPSETTTGARVAACLQFFGVSNIEDWHRRYQAMIASSAFKTSATKESTVGAVAAWLRQGEILASRIPCSRWNPASFQAELSNLREVTRQSKPEIFIAELVRRCANHGVALAVVPAPSGCRASGLTRFLSRSKALLLLSLRYRWHDSFWFSFFHEAGHLLLHSENAVFVEGIGTETTYEHEANQFAEELLIPSKYAARLRNVAHDAREIMRLAQELGVSRGIVVGQLHHKGIIGQERMNHLRRRFSLTN
jgi:HTH-type transcriptional regulator/antitoxin HigA